MYRECKNIKSKKYIKKSYKCILPAILAVIVLLQFYSFGASGASAAVKVSSKTGTLAATVMEATANTPAGPETMLSNLKDKAAGVSEKETETLQKLFTQAQKIEETGKKVQAASGDIGKAQVRIDSLKKLIEQDKAEFEKEQESLKLVLQSYQRMGPGSYLEILFQSDSLPDLLSRINLLRDLAHNTGDLMDRINEDREKQGKEQEKLTEELALLQNNRKQLEQDLADEKKLKEDMENYLASLQNERVRYQGELNGIQQAWNGIKPVYEETAKEFAEFTGKVNLPPDMLKISFSFSGMEVSISDTAINSLLTGDPKLNGIRFMFSKEKVTLEFPESSLTLTGKFVIADDYCLAFKPEGGTFFGMPLEKGTAAELSENYSIKLDLKSQLQGAKLKSADTGDGFLKVSL
jgi:peptidoglycan hydrolase CwlO-like protein